MHNGNHINEEVDGLFSYLVIGFRSLCVCASWVSAIPFCSSPLSRSNHLHLVHRCDDKETCWMRNYPSRQWLDSLQSEHTQNESLDNEGNSKLICFSFCADYEPTTICQNGTKFNSPHEMADEIYGRCVLVNGL